MSALSMSPPILFHETPETDPDIPPNQCPSCPGSLVSTSIETFCPSCGVVTDASPIVTQPSYRPLRGPSDGGNSDGYGYDQIGPPSSPFRDKNGSTVIGYGSGPGKFKIIRLRRLDAKSRLPSTNGVTRDAHAAERFAKRLGSVLSIPPAVVERAYVIYGALPKRPLGRDGSAHLRTYEERFTASLVVACRERGIPVRLRKVAEVSGLKQKVIGRTLRLYQAHLPGTTAFLNPEGYLRTFMSHLNWGREAREAALSLLVEFTAARQSYACSPATNAAGIMGAISQRHPGWRLSSYSEIARVAGVTEVTVRNHRKVIDGTLGRTPILIPNSE